LPLIVLRSIVTLDPQVAKIPPPLHSPGAPFANRATLSRTVLSRRTSVALSPT